jgi:hypothetical protein
MSNQLINASGLLEITKARAKKEAKAKKEKDNTI